MAVSLAVLDTDSRILSDLLQQINDNRHFSVLDWVSRLDNREQWIVLQRAANKGLCKVVAGVAMNLMGCRVGFLPQLHEVQRLNSFLCNMTLREDKGFEFASQQVRSLIARVKANTPTQAPIQSSKAPTQLDRPSYDYTHFMFFVSVGDAGQSPSQQRPPTVNGVFND